MTSVLAAATTPLRNGSSMSAAAKVATSSPVALVFCAT
jgi:hypothetical protein